MSNRHLVLPTYGLSAALILFPLLDAGVSSLPLRPGEAVWRVAALESFTRALLFPLMGMMLTLTVAVLTQQWRAASVISLIAGFALLMLTAVIPVFILDQLRLRSAEVATPARVSDAAAAVAALKLAANWLLLLWCLLSARHVARRLRRHKPAPVHKPMETARPV